MGVIPGSRISLANKRLLTNKSTNLLAADSIFVFIDLHLKHLLLWQIL